MWSMVFSPIGQYAIRIMAVVASAPNNARLRSADLAESTSVPASYLAKVCRRLTEAGLLDSKKGHRGGFRLTRPADAITFDDILRAVDAMPDAVSCAFGWGRCDATEPCPLHEQWSALSARILSWAAENTLASVDCSTLDDISHRMG